LTCRRSYLDW